VTPGLVPGELPYLLPGTDALSRHRLLLDNFTRAAQNAPYELYAFYQGLQVISARVAAFIEVMELDVSRRQLPRAAPSALPSPDCRRAVRRLHRSPRRRNRSWTGEISPLLPPLLRPALQRDDGQHGVDGRDDCGRRGRSPRQLSPLASDQSRRGVEGVDGGRNAQRVGTHPAVSQQ
jgi:hypothetical protein